MNAFQHAVDNIFSRNKTNKRFDSISPAQQYHGFLPNGLLHSIPLWQKSSVPRLITPVTKFFIKMMNILQSGVIFMDPTRWVGVAFYFRLCIAPQWDNIFIHFGTSARHHIVYAHRPIASSRRSSPLWRGVEGCKLENVPFYEPRRIAFYDLLFIVCSRIRLA